MKWFQHLSDSHNNPKTRMVVRKQGWLGHSLMWICREMVAKYGEDYRIKGEKGWKVMLTEYFHISEQKLDSLLAYHAEVNIISAKALKEGDLHIPKMSDYSDIYSNRVRRKFAQCENNVPLDKITLDKIREHYIKLKGWDLKNVSGSDHAYITKGMFLILERTKGDVDLAMEAITWGSKLTWPHWDLQFVDKRWAEFMKEKEQNVPASSRVADLSHLKV